jgi:hypothetical protein
MTNTESNIDEKTKETRFNLSIFSGFILIGFVIIGLFSSISEDGSSGPASSALWGYSIILFSLIGIIFVKIKMTNDDNKDVLSYIVGKGLPVFLLLFNILWLISLNVTYFEDINKGIVSKDFYEYSMLNTILIFVQLLISLEVIMEKAFGYSASNTLINATGSQVNSEQKNMIIYIMSFIFIITNFVLSGIQQVTLDYFTTDG